MYLNPAALEPVSEWVWPYRRFWAESFSRLDEHLARLDPGGQP